jgi:hypothetical protein
MADLFGRTAPIIKTPLTADQATINWGGIVTAAINIQIAYSQPVTRRHTIGNQDAVIFAGQPAGNITIARLLTTDASSLFSAPGWQACNPGTLSLTLAGGCVGSSVAAVTLTASACVVTNFQVSAEAEGLTVMDNVAIEFLQLTNS